MQRRSLKHKLTLLRNNKMNEVATNFSWQSVAPLAPELFLSAAGLLLLAFGVFRANTATFRVLWLTVFAMIATAFLVIQSDGQTVKILNNMVVIDGFSNFLKIIIALGVAVSLVLSAGWLKENRLFRFEYSLLILFSTIGMMLMVSSNNLMSLYVSLELQSLCLYVLAAIRRETVMSSEAGIKYFVLGALSSGLLLFGTSLIYGYTGSLDFDLIANTLAQNSGNIAPGAIIGMVFILAGLAFKVSAVPFHMWAPDVYQGAPTAVTAFFALVPKIAATGLIVRLLSHSFAPLTHDWAQIISFVAIASVIWSALAALAQENIKRLMAYSSINNIGYILIGMLAGTPEGVASVMTYMVIYMVMTAGTFAFIMNMRRDGQPVETIGDLAGLSKSSPVMAYTMAALMFSLSGIPPFAGFFAKLFVFQAAISTGHYIVATLGIVGSVIAAYYYLRIVKVMFFDKSELVLDHNPYISRNVVLLGSVALISLFIVMPNALMNQALLAAQSLFQ